MNFYDFLAVLTIIYLIQFLSSMYVDAKTIRKAIDNGMTGMELNIFIAILENKNKQVKQLLEEYSKTNNKDKDSSIEKIID